MRARYYDSTTGRFISEDPAFDGFNWYAYCGGNPLNRWDPSGQAWYDWAPGMLSVTAGTIMCATGFGTPVGIGLITGGVSNFTISGLGAAGFDSKFVSMATAGIDVVGGAALLMTPFAAVGAGMIGSGFGSLAGGVISENLGGSYELGAYIGNIVGGAAGGAVYGKISAAKSTNNVCEPNCFVAGTLIETAEGKKPIEEITTGDMVFAEDPETGEIAMKKVVQTFENESNELVHIFVNGEEIITTPNHPFYVPERGWTLAIKLRAGDLLVLSNGEYVIVEAVQHEILESPVKVYNFEVEDFHTYFVGESSVLVHNTCRLEDDTLVVRGGQSSSDNLKTNQLKDPRGHISANYANGVSLDVLATTPQPFKNGKISLTTVGDIRKIGMDVIPDPTALNPFHASIVPLNNPITTEEAELLSSLFKLIDNVWR